MLTLRQKGKIDQRSVRLLSRLETGVAQMGRAAMPRKGHPPIIIGHRGHAEHLENTLVSFQEAIRQGSQMIELDVRLAKDEVPVVIHDSTLARVTGGRKGSVSHRTSKHLTSLELDGGLRILTLREALEELIPLVPVNVELKFNRPDYRPLVNAVCQVIEDMQVPSRLLISSFYHGSLEVVEKVLPEVQIAPLFGSPTGPVHQDDLDKIFSRKIKKPKPGDLPLQGRTAVVYSKMIDAELVQRFEDNSGTLLTYTVDAPSEMVRLIKLGLDGIITNRPTLLAKIIEEIF